MKIFAAIFVIFVISLALAQEDEDERIFQSYLEKFRLRIGRNGNDKAKKNVLKILKEVRKQNEKFEKGEDTFKAELNELSYKDPEQIAVENLGFIEPPPSNNSTPLPDRVKRSVLPDYFNWVDKGVVRPVSNQGSCGSCYAFAAVGAIESRACILRGQCKKLSEQEAMECTNLCKGGWDDWVYTYAKNIGGCTSNSYYYLPYARSSCSAASTRARESNTTPITWYFLQGYGEATIRQYLKDLGPMFISFDVYENFYSYSHGIYSSNSGNYLGGHAILLVGWGTENGVPYWILRNSWGTNWGESGYFRMKRGINLCRLESTRVSVPIIA